jgi:protein-L-isoaspartate O-methyltransferase
MVYPENYLALIELLKKHGVPDERLSAALLDVARRHFIDSDEARDALESDRMLVIYEP